MCLNTKNENQSGEYLILGDKIYEDLFQTPERLRRAQEQPDWLQVPQSLPLITGPNFQGQIQIGQSSLWFK